MDAPYLLTSADISGTSRSFGGLWKDFHNRQPRKSSIFGKFYPSLAENSSAPARSLRRSAMSCQRINWDGCDGRVCAVGMRDTESTVNEVTPSWKNVASATAGGSNTWHRILVHSSITPTPDHSLATHKGG
jgi:hypothetical protein